MLCGDSQILNLFQQSLAQKQWPRQQHPSPTPAKKQPTLSTEQETEQEKKLKLKISVRDGKRRVMQKTRLD